MCCQPKGWHLDLLEKGANAQRRALSCGRRPRRGKALRKSLERLNYHWTSESESSLHQNKTRTDMEGFMENISPRWHGWTVAKV